MCTVHNLYFIIEVNVLYRAYKKNRHSRHYGLYDFEQTIKGVRMDFKIQNKNKQK